MSSKIFLIGLPGTGKTTMGMELAMQLNLPFVDLDQEIEKNEKQSVTSIFEEHGEAYFRQLEKLYLQKVIDELAEFVLATGGGTPCFFDNMKLMNATGATVFIDTPIQTIKERIKEDTTRPLMKSNTLEKLYEERKTWYAKAKE